MRAASSVRQDGRVPGVEVARPRRLDCRASLAMTMGEALAMTMGEALAMARDGVLAMARDWVLAMTAGMADTEGWRGGRRDPP